MAVLAAIGALLVPTASASAQTPASPVWYFAEGSSLDGVLEYITLLSTSTTEPALVEIHWYGQPGRGGNLKNQVAVRPGQRVTVDARVPTGGGVARGEPGLSAVVTTIQGPPVIAERVIYFGRTFDIGAVSGSYSALGVNEPARIWHFAEGSTLEGFQTYLAILNPNDVPLTVTVAYDTEGPITQSGSSLHMQEGSRATVDVLSSDPGGLGRRVTGFAASVSADLPIVVERVMYVNRPVGSLGNVNDGDASFGTPVPRGTTFFAEGTALPEFSEYLLLANPAPTSTRLRLTYYLDGPVAPVEREVTVESRRRLTIPLLDVDAPGALGRAAPRAANPTSVGFALRVETVEGPAAVVERSGYVAGRDFGHGVLSGATSGSGVPAPAATWTFAEGSIRPGFDEFLVLANIATTSVVADVRYQVRGAPEQPRAVVVPAKQRVTIRVDGDPTQGGLGPPVEDPSADRGTVIKTRDHSAVLIAQRVMYTNRTFPEDRCERDPEETFPPPPGPLVNHDFRCPFGQKVVMSQLGVSGAAIGIGHPS